MLKKFDKNHMIMAAALVVSAVVRAFCFSYESIDSIDICKWVEGFRAGGGFAALSDTVSNYNPPYLYIMVLFSYLPQSWDLYMIKLLSATFDIIIAATVYRVALPYSKRAAAWGFAAVMLMPTFIFNSAYWGQCDSIYAAFCLLAFERAVNDKPKASVIMAGVAVAFKLQAAIFLPFFLVLLAAKRVKLWHAALFPLPYVILSLPALALGWSLSRLIGVYPMQTRSFFDLTFNAPNIYTFIPTTNPLNPYQNLWGGYFYIGLGLTALFCLSVIVFAFTKCKNFDTAQLAGFAAVITLGIPWLMPLMHDRFFCLAEMFMLLYAALRPRCAFMSVMVAAGSFGGYFMGRILHIYPSSSLWPSALLLLLALIAACWTLTSRKAKQFWRSNDNDVKEV